MPFVRNPRDRNKQIENQQNENNALRKDLGTVGSIGGSLLQDTRTGGTSSAPTLTSPTPERKTANPRATNLGDLAAANIDKTQALSQDIASQQAGQVRDYNRRLGEAQADLQTGLDASPDPTRSKALVDEFREKAKAGDLTTRDYTDLRGAFDNYQGPETLSGIDRGISETEANIASQGRDTQTGARGALQQRLASEGTYSTGARNLDTALVGQQSNALQQTGRAAAGVGGQSQATDETIRSLANQRRTNLAELPGQVYEDVRTDFEQNEQLYDNMARKIQNTQLNTTEAQQLVNTANADLTRKRDAYNNIQGVRQEISNRFRLKPEDLSRYEDIAKNEYDYYINKSNEEGLNWVGYIKIDTLRKIKNEYLPRILEQEKIIPNGVQDVEAAEWMRMVTGSKAREVAANTYLQNFSDDELARAGVTRQDVLDYATRGDFDINNTTGILQRMNVQTDQRTPEDQAYIAALQHLARLSGGELTPTKNTKTSKKEGE